MPAVTVAGDGYPISYVYSVVFVFLYDDLVKLGGFQDKLFDRYEYAGVDYGVSLPLVNDGCLVDALGFAKTVDRSTSAKTSSTIPARRNTVFIIVFSDEVECLNSSIIDGIYPII